MICTKCRSPHSEVVNTRSTRGGSQIWRRRRCANCGKVSTTYERQDLSFIQVVSGAQQPIHTSYRRSFLFSSILKSVPEDQLSLIDIDNLIDTIEFKLLDRGEEIIKTEAIKQIVLETLKPIDMNVFMNYLAAHLDFRTKSDINAAIKPY
ncbi:MAG: hypothetical protein WCI47_00360 [bacterium]